MDRARRMTSMIEREASQGATIKEARSNLPLPDSLRRGALLSIIRPPELPRTLFETE